MGDLFKNILILFLAIVVVIVIAAVAIVVLFDPNDFRDDIAAEVKRTTGRDLVIEGDLELSLFPWFAIDVGKTTLGNAQGFGDEPFLSFEAARLSVRVLPMLLHRQVAVGTATLDAFELNLAVARDGRTNWQDLIETGEAPPPEAESAGEPTSIDIAGIDISNATVVYDDAQAGERYRLTNFNVRSGHLARGQPIDLESDFDFELQPADLAGDLEIELEMLLDGDAGTVDFSNVDMTVLIRGGFRTGSHHCRGSVLAEEPDGAHEHRAAGHRRSGCARQGLRRSRRAGRAGGDHAKGLEFRGRRHVVSG